MKYSEAKKAIEALSSKYSAYKDIDTEFFNVYYKNGEVAYVRTNERYSITVRFEKYFPKLPFSNKLYMILAELAMTPIKDRVEQKKYRVIVAQDPNKYFSTYLWLRTEHSHIFLLGSIDSSYYKGHIFNTKYDLGVFTADQYKDLIKYIKTLPDGEWQAKVAKHGKTEI